MPVAPGCDFSHCEQFLQWRTWRRRVRQFLKSQGIRASLGWTDDQLFGAIKGLAEGKQKRSRETTRVKVRQEGGRDGNERYADSRPGSARSLAGNAGSETARD